MPQSSSAAEEARRRVLNRLHLQRQAQGDAQEAQGRIYGGEARTDDVDMLSFLRNVAGDSPVPAAARTSVVTNEERQRLLQDMLHGQTLGGAAKWMMPRAAGKGVRTQKGATVGRITGG